MDCYSLPTSVLIEEQEFKIRNNADYRVILDCFDALEDIELDSNMRVYTAMIIFYEAISELEDIPKFFGDNIKEAVSEMYRFFNCGKRYGTVFYNFKSRIFTGKPVDFGTQFLASHSKKRDCLNLALRHFLNLSLCLTLNLLLFHDYPIYKL